jgi:hypothetical protein
MRIDENRATLVETLSAAEFQRLERDLPGVLLSREVTTFVKLDPDWFLDFATSHGDDADRSFFAAYKQTYPDGVWPAYVMPQTDYSGCVAFGEGRLVAAYRTWSEYGRSHPQRYKLRADAELDQVGKALAESTCACDDVATVEKEMQQFVRALPRSPIADRVSDRLRAVRDGRSGIRYRCVSG